MFSEPVIFNEPVIWTESSAANIKLLLLFSAEPFPTIKAASADDEILYLPCTCCLLPSAIVPNPSAWE